MNKNIKNNVIKDKNQKMTHIQISCDDICGAKIAILPGDPKRVSIIAKNLNKDAYQLNDKREYCSYIAKNINGVNVLVISTGIGSPSTLICLEELAMLGVKTFIRIGTTGSINKDVKIGDIVISEASVRLDPITQHYAPVEYPAVANIDLISIFKKYYLENKIKFHTGITASSGTFYPGQERYNSYSGYIIKEMQNTLEQWQKLNVINYEMESGALYLWTKIMGLKSICMSVVVSQRDNSEKLITYDADKEFNKIIDAIKCNIEQIVKLED